MAVMRSEMVDCLIASAYALRLLPADWTCCAQEGRANARTRINKKMNEIRSGNFSHSGKAELYPEFVLCDMGPFREWCVSAGLDAFGYAAAGRKLTLNEGLRRENCQQRKRKGIV